MAQWTETQCIEIFQLLFLRQMGEKLDKKLYALKGGCNLRFFMRSIRYSEDMDLDVQIVAPSTLNNSVRKILESRSLLQTLEAKKIIIQKFSESKQTETTQRWKLSLLSEGSVISIPTKIEFSRRKIDQGIRFESVDAEIINRYRLYPIFANHYSKETAFAQKLGALAHRKETQARDIFDLNLLIDMGLNSFSQKKIKKGELEQAVQNATSLQFEDFKGQVVAYLLPEYQKIYDSEKMWKEMVSKVVDALEKLKP